jgi:hypothetical protein
VGITARAARYGLDFRSITPELTDGTPRAADAVMIEGGGVLFKIGRELRVNVNVDYYRRLSPMLLRRYSGLRAGSSVSYGF